MLLGEGAGCSGRTGSHTGEKVGKEVTQGRSFPPGGETREFTSFYLRPIARFPTPETRKCDGRCRPARSVLHLFYISSGGWISAVPLVAINNLVLMRVITGLGNRSPETPVFPGPWVRGFLRCGDFGAGEALRFVDAEFHMTKRCNKLFKRLDPPPPQKKCLGRKAPLSR